MIISTQDFNKASCEAIEALQNAGGKVYVVGGYVRDTLLGVKPKDVDLMVTGLNKLQVETTLKKLKGKVKLTGKDFGVFRFTDYVDEVEIALPRKEISTGDKHTDFEIVVDHTLSVEDDLWRRDFTVNAMDYDLQENKVIDPYNGHKDMTYGILRQVNPNSIGEDPIRILRALVLHSRYSLEPDRITVASMAANANKLALESGERIRMELDKLFSSRNPQQGIWLAHDCRVLECILPEVEDCFGYDQNNPHHEQELGMHLLSVLSYVSHVEEDKDIRLAALLHDIGKPGSEWIDPETGSNHFYKKILDDGTVLGDDHEELGSRMTYDLMKKLGYSNERIKRVSELVKYHMYSPFTTAKGARKFIRRVGEHADDLLVIRRGDQGGKAVYDSRPDGEFDLDKEKALLDEVRRQKEPTNLSQLAINGSDLLALGFDQGPGIGEVLNRLTERVVDDPSLNERQTLIDLALADTPSA